ncbi:MAG TPA: cytochrome c peroxidase [Burkholderiales bacterium]|nr:cytochrome c peroxidase [Burkholderiales bacterium]
MTGLGAAALAAVYALSPLGAPAPDATDRAASDPGAARLGQYLFFYRGFSADGRIACASCHQPARAFSDGRPLAKGLATGTRNTPTLLNVAYGHWFFWDGRADSLWSQPVQVFENPKEMGSSRQRVARAVESDRALKRAYAQVFGPMPPLAGRAAVERVVANVGKALEAYERELVSRDAPFDRYVAALRRGDPGADGLLSPAAQRGLALFVGPAHCTLCHSGPDFSDGEFHNLGLPRLPGRLLDSGRADAVRELAANPFNGAGRFSDAPRGAARDRLAYLPKPETELGKFKTPTLRNVALTAPYMHDGRFATLRDVLQFYAQGKAAGHGRVVGQREATLDLVPHLTPGQISDLIAFLDSLTGAPLPAALTRQPDTP